MNTEVMQITDNLWKARLEMEGEMEEEETCTTTGLAAITRKDWRKWGADELGEGI